MSLGQRAISIFREAAVLLLFGALGAVVFGIGFPALWDLFLPVSESAGKGVFLGDGLLGSVIECTILGSVVGVVSWFVLRRRWAGGCPRNGQAGWPVFQPAKPHELLLGSVLLILGFVLGLRGIGRFIEISPRPFPAEVLVVAAVLVFGFTAVGLFLSFLGMEDSVGPGGMKTEGSSSLAVLAERIVFGAAVTSTLVALVYIAVHLTSWWTIPVLAVFFSVAAVVVRFTVREGRREFVRGRQPLEDDGFLAFFDIRGAKQDLVLAWRDAIAVAAGVDPWFIHPRLRTNELYDCFGTGWDSVPICMEMEDVLARAGEGSVTLSGKLPSALDRHFARSIPTIAEYITYALSIIDEHMEREERPAGVSS